MSLSASVPKRTTQPGPEHKIDEAPAFADVDRQRRIPSEEGRQRRKQHRPRQTAATYVAEVTALGRPGLPDDIGPMIASLLSADNRWINAQRIEVWGGQAI